MLGHIEATQKLGPCQVRSKTDHPCPHQAVVEIWGLPTLLPSGLPSLLGSLARKFLLPLVRELVSVRSLAQLPKPSPRLGM